MADTVATQVLIDGPRNTVMKFTNISDGTGENIVRKVDVDALSGANSKVRIDRIDILTAGMGVQLYWGGVDDVVSIPADEAQTLCFGDIGGLYIDDGREFTRNLFLSTIGASSGDRYTLIIHMVKTNDPTDVVADVSLSLDFVADEYTVEGVPYASFGAVPGSSSSGGVNGTVIINGVITPASAPRIGDGGLVVEVSRTNLLLNNTTLSTQGVTVTAVAHTISFYGTGTITLTGTSTAGPLVGTGVNDRVSLTFTPTAGTLTCTVSGSVTNAQLEIGSFGTSAITTAGSAVTRTADVNSISISTWFNPTAGTVVHGYNLPDAAPGASNRFLSFNDGSSTNAIKFTEATSDRIIGGIVDGGVTQANFSTGQNFTPGTNGKVALAWEVNNFAQSTDGGTVVTDTSGTVPSGITDLDIGKGVSVSQINGEIREITYYPTRRTNAQLIGDTS